MVCFPDDFLFFVGNVETYFTHTINVWKCVSPIVNLFYRCVPVIVEVGLKISFALVGHTVQYLWISVHVFPIEILTHTSQYAISRNLQLFLLLMYLVVDCDLKVSNLLDIRNRTLLYASAYALTLPYGRLSITVLASYSRSVISLCLRCTKYPH